MLNAGFPGPLAFSKRHLHLIYPSCSRTKGFIFKAMWTYYRYKQILFTNECEIECLPWGGKCFPMTRNNITKRKAACLNFGLLFCCCRLETSYISIKGAVCLQCARSHISGQHWIFKAACRSFLGWVRSPSPAWSMIISSFVLIQLISSSEPQH